mmetsp:Transcript_27015/g.78637  ORF Transcript_27015/g.78637 Transcript_27015/m.78637 type:complete len:284 (+) Transcript_27015:488-1339(+)
MGFLRRPQPLRRRRRRPCRPRLPSRCNLAFLESTPSTLGRRCRGVEVLGGVGVEAAGHPQAAGRTPRTGATGGHALTPRPPEGWSCPSSNTRLPLPQRLPLPREFLPLPQQQRWEQDGFRGCPSCRFRRPHSLASSTHPCHSLRPPLPRRSTSLHQRVLWTSRGSMPSHRSNCTRIRPLQRWWQLLQPLCPLPCPPLPPPHHPAAQRRPPLSSPGPPQSPRGGPSRCLPVSRPTFWASVLALPWEAPEGSPPTPGPLRTSRLGTERRATAVRDRSLLICFWTL